MEPGKIGNAMSMGKFIFASNSGEKTTHTLYNAQVDDLVKFSKALVETRGDLCPSGEISAAAVCISAGFTIVAASKFPFRSILSIGSYARAMNVVDRLMGPNADDDYGEFCRSSDRMVIIMIEKETNRFYRIYGALKNPVFVFPCLLDKRLCRQDVTLCCTTLWITTRKEWMT